MQEAMQAWEAPGAAIAIVHGDETVYIRGYGVRELGKDDPVTPETLFAIGSTTKAFVTAAMAILVDEGKMAWDDPVRKHVPFFHLSDPLADSNVTLRDLVCHRTGMSRHDLLWYGSPWSREEIIRKIGLVKSSTSFRSRWEYQNIMFLTAGYAVGLASGSSWEEFTRKRIFEPLGMTGANFSTKDAEKAADHASPHAKIEEKVQAIPWRNIDNVGPAGSINAGVRDLTRWIRLQLNEGVFEGTRLISKENLNETHLPQMVVPRDEESRLFGPETIQTSYGLGWGVSDYHGHRLVSHGGGIDGFRTQVALLPQDKIGIAIVANITPSALPEAVLNGVIDALLDRPRRNWVTDIRERQKKGESEAKKREEEWKAKRREGTSPSRELAAYAGAYEEPAYGTAHVTLENGALALQWSSFSAPLEHWHLDTFVGPEKAPTSALEKARVLFRLDAEGEIEGMKLLDVEFKKVKPKADPASAAAAESAQSAMETPETSTPECTAEAAPLKTAATPDAVELE